MKKFRILILVVALVSPVALADQRPSIAPLNMVPPNIVLIVADDLGYGDLGCYGGKLSRTPHLDALAARGLRFTDYHSAGSMCSPTRASLLTGCYPQRFGRAFDAALSGTTMRHVGLPLEAVTVAELLQSRGYATACFGKWHLGYQAPFLPNRQGFDQFRGLLSGDGDFHTHVDRSGNADWYENEAAKPESGYTTDLLTKHCLAFIEAQSDKPFFLYLPHLAIHFPWQGPNDPPHRQPGKSYHDDKWGIIPNPENVAPHVKAMVEFLDAGVGRVMETLRRHGLEENTLVIFTSDNGGYLNYGARFRNISSNGIYRGQKAELYEGGHRVPMIVAWPGRIEPGVSHALVHSNDLLPTIAAIAKPNEATTSCDGMDLSPHLLRGDSLPERTLFWRTPSAQAVRRGPWKLCITGQKTELYRLDDDPGETMNLATAEPALVKELNDAWGAWNADVVHSAKAFE